MGWILYSQNCMKNSPNCRAEANMNFFLALLLFFPSTLAVYNIGFLPAMSKKYPDDDLNKYANAGSEYAAAIRVAMDKLARMDEYRDLQFTYTFKVWYLSVSTRVQFCVWGIFS